MQVLILLIEAVVVYGLVLGAHALRQRFGLAPFYALMGGLTAVMSWVTDAGVHVNVMGVTFLVGSTVFYTSLLLGVFVVYVFDGPRATRIAISTVVGVSAMVPVIAVVLNFQMHLVGQAPLGYVPSPSLRINSASVFATLMDLLFLAIAWEFLNNHAHRLHYTLRAYLTLLGVMWLDVALFNTGAFAGTPDYWRIMPATFLSRLVIGTMAAPILWAYLGWQNSREGASMEQRPVLAILRQMSEIKQELSVAKQEIERRKVAERELKESRERLRTLATTDELTGLPNRRHLLEMGRREAARARRYRGELCLLMMDLDHFKEVNDTHGHAAGDQVLADFAHRAGRALRDTDALGRLGGEEFAALLLETSLATAREVAERLRQAVGGEPFALPQGAVSVTVSIGVARLRAGDGEPGQALDMLLRRADRALYEAKRQGRDRVVVHD